MNGVSYDIPGMRVQVPLSGCFVCFVPVVPQLQSDWSLSCDHGLDNASYCENNNNNSSSNNNKCGVLVRVVALSGPSSAKQFVMADFFLFSNHFTRMHTKRILTFLHQNVIPGAYVFVSLLHRIKNLILSCGVALSL